ncbi:unnamed protein product [Caenorhabditis angaria]|uniref:Uncharacterized protein n=1 Tax=Caenorhabditis angaria TaxID=860376 RepID=A0A9P1IRE8_9PELO|nr:unnamed protein product [Caenorhabditis angaria]
MSVIFHENPGTSLGNIVTQINNDTEKSPEWIENLFSNASFIDSPTHTVIRGFCQDVFSYRIPGFEIRYWDAAILLPNLLFLLFLFFKCQNVINRCQKGNSPVFRAFFLLVYISTLVNVIRSVYSMTITMTNNPLEESLNQTLWIIIKFFYLTAEFSALTFALLFGHLDNGRSILIALLVTLVLSIPHTTAQLLIEMKLVNISWIENPYLEVDVGQIFWILSSTLIALAYFIVLCLPLICCQKYTKLPSKLSFFIYCMMMILLNLFQAFGATLILFKSSDGLCFVGLSTKKMKTPPNNQSGLFMYRKHKDEQGSGELPDVYMPRFSGLTSPSYDDLFDYNRDARFTHYDSSTNEYVQNHHHYNTYSTPLIMSTIETAESTVTTRTGSDDYTHHRDSMLFDTSTTTRHLKGLGPHGSLVFEDHNPSNQ